MMYNKGPVKKLVDTHGWDIKNIAVQKAIQAGISKAVDFGIEEIFREAAKNLAGPVDNTGKMPIPRISKNLSSSLKWFKVSPEVGAVYSDGTVAIYNRAVHDGIPGTKRGPRRFLTDAVRVKRTLIKDKMEKEIISEVQKVGR